ncbi:hypothetical protein W97_02948 [Coniosporium apollinis CBS 100218]|uniref:Large ribosomal subunit protein mL44 n=1 Tax=Coniosporium apollinis (strain CBS 100218) TaxID=1168221 RepID=R7YP61_CONA1|nr:uncharacterized protein W97_02948 [Coniosporium apollinis CBS 100218]EON63720.1 hypothetical protein W97_02948 [Coniosporium apollinis CBS 100218]
MKRARIERWGSQLLQSRPQGTRPQCLYQQPQHPQPHNHRPQWHWQAVRAQSTTSTPLSSPSRRPPPASHAPRIPRESLPSPPLSAARSSAKLSALHARLSLPSRLPLETLARALIDPSADPNPDLNNASLALLGQDLLGYYTAEHLLAHYPRLPQTVLYAAQYAYVGGKTLAAVTREWGVEAAAEPGGEVDPGLLQFKRVKPGTDISGAAAGETIGPDGVNRSQWRLGMGMRNVSGDEFGDINASGLDAAAGVTLEDASKTFVRALVGAVYLHCGQLSTKRFYASHFLSRQLDLSTLFAFRTPTRDLSRLCAREGFEAPVARLLSETGRLSRHPVFVVGVYSGPDKLGEGAGASLDEARTRAAAAALKSWYLYSPEEVTVPSEAEGKGDQGKRWVPCMVDCGEVIA